ncbi:MAG: dTDP-4-amino-4,6-dideoxygalactose transaminase [Planctomycetota bacterium]
MTSIPPSESIPFAIPLHQHFNAGREREYVDRVLTSGQLSGGGSWMDRAEEMLRERFEVRHALLTSSGTHALEAAALAAGLGPGDEVLVPAWAFPTTASCILRSGATVVFVDSTPNDPGIDIEDLRRKVTRKTRAVIALHYAGLPCDMNAIMDIAKAQGLLVIEDAAQAFDAKLNESYLGTMGDIGCISFHGTKNITCGEGGVLLSNDDELAQALIRIREMGTDRRMVVTKRAQHYTWRDLGSSYLPSEVAAAILCAQLEKADEISVRRRAIFHRYLELLEPLAQRGLLSLPRPLEGAIGNGHLFYINLDSRTQRDLLRQALAQEGIEALPHFMALDSTPMGQRLGLADGTIHSPCPEAKRLEETTLRLPIYPNLSPNDQDRVIAALFAALSRAD